MPYRRRSRSVVFRFVLACGLLLSLMSFGAVSAQDEGPIQPPGGWFRITPTSTTCDLPVLFEGKAFNPSTLIRFRPTSWYTGHWIPNSQTYEVWSDANGDFNFWASACTDDAISPDKIIWAAYGMTAPGVDSIHGALVFTVAQTRDFPETGHTVRDQILAQWSVSGAIPIFGYPITDEFTETNPDTGNPNRVQYFERQRIEIAPDRGDHMVNPYSVLLGRIGAELLEAQGRDWTTFPKGDPNAPHYMDATGHAIAPQFWTFWSSHGFELSEIGTTFRESLALFGYPLSEPMLETNADGDTVLTQYFERAVFEYHPDNPDPYKVQLRRVGAELLATR